MTLMEAVVALVILALAAIGCLELAQGASRLEFNATAWNEAVSVAESRMAQVSLGASEAADNSPRMQTQDAARAGGTIVTREPWRAGLDLVSVSVPVVDGKRYVLRKVVRAAAIRTSSSVP
ncbi:MAG: hypothetical protein H7Z40_12050 [Phycisphaerae bacterium]|nr:hypothetical protein [Gemmatimonadaceae bacterium]